MKEAILIIDDEPSIVDNIAYALSTEGFEAVSCGTGADALAVLNSRKISLIVLDVCLPDCGGFELAREIRSRFDIPIIFVTGRTGEIDRVVGLEIGADDYVVKPFSPRELTARVKAVLRRCGSNPRSASGGTELVGDFEHDPKRMAIRYRGTRLELSRYEYRLLAALLQHPGRVFTRDALMELAWEEPEMSLDRTVDTHIKTIRQKLKRVALDKDPIQTHRGVGYSLRERQ